MQLRWVKIVKGDTPLVTRAVRLLVLALPLLSPYAKYTSTAGVNGDSKSSTGISDLDHCLYWGNRTTSAVLPL